VHQGFAQTHHSLLSVKKFGASAEYLDVPYGLADIDRLLDRECCVKSGLTGARGPSVLRLNECCVHRFFVTVQPNGGVTSIYGGTGVLWWHRRLACAVNKVFTKYFFSRIGETPVPRL